MTFIYMTIDARIADHQLFSDARGRRRITPSVSIYYYGVLWRYTPTHEDKQLYNEYLDT